MQFFNFWIICVVLLSCNTLYVSWRVIAEDTSTAKDISDGSHELSDLNPSGSDSSVPLSGKRPRQSNNAFLERKRIRNTYYVRSKPLKISLSEEQKQVVSQKAHDLYSSKDPPFKWPGLDTVLEEDLDQFCINIWLTIDLDVKNTVTIINTPCIATKLLYQESQGPGGCRYVGYYGFLKAAENKTFTGDFVRCNCLYEKHTQYWSMITVKNSKHFFFIYKFLNDGFFILSNINAPSSRLIHIIDFHPLKDVIED